MKRICVIDGQGGGIGATLIKYLKARSLNDILHTNFIESHEGDLL